MIQTIEQRRNYEVEWESPSTGEMRVTWFITQKDAEEYAERKAWKYGTVATVYKLHYTEAGQVESRELLSEYEV